MLQESILLGATLSLLLQEILEDDHGTPLILIWIQVLHHPSSLYHRNHRNRRHHLLPMVAVIQHTLLAVPPILMALHLSMDTTGESIASIQSTSRPKSSQKHTQFGHGDSYVAKQEVPSIMVHDSRSSLHREKSFFVTLDIADSAKTKATLNCSFIAFRCYLTM